MKANPTRNSTQIHNRERTPRASRGKEAPKEL